MNDLRTAAQQALEALDWHSRHGANWASIDEATETLRAALAEPVQEPVAWWHRKSDTFTSGSLVANFKEWTPLYSALPQRKPLTNGDIMTMWPESVLALPALEFARAIERAHGIK